MNISLTPELEERIMDKVRSGRYASPGEVVREAVRLLEFRDRNDDDKLEALRADIKEGLESGESKPLDFDEFRAEARRRLEKQQNRPD